MSNSLKRPMDVFKKFSWWMVPVAVFIWSILSNSMSDHRYGLYELAKQNIKKEVATKDDFIFVRECRIDQVIGILTPTLSAFLISGLLVFFLREARWREDYEARKTEN